MALQPVLRSDRARMRRRLLRPWCWCGAVATSLLVWLTAPAGAHPQADAEGDRLIQASQAVTAASPSFEIRQTLEQRAVVVVDGKRVDAPKTAPQVSLIEVDLAHDLMRLTTHEPGGREVIAIRRGGRVAIKLGSELWQVPAGPYVAVTAQLVNPFACPLPVPGPGSPRWQVTATEGQGDEAVVIVQTVADSAVRFAEGRMKEGLNAVFPDPAARPKLEVLSYTARHWIRKKDHRRLKVVQDSREKMTMPQPNGAAIVLDTTAITTAVYSRYGEVQVVVPEAALRILDATAAPERKP